MSRSMSDSGPTEQESTAIDHTPSGHYFGTDGAGRDHYYQLGTRKMTIVDGDGTTAKRIPEHRDLIDYALAVLNDAGEPWQEVRVEYPKNRWLTGEVAVGEFPERDA